MFIDFFFYLREAGIRVGVTEWLTLLQGLEKGLAKTSVGGFYELARCTLVKRENDYDSFDQAFSRYFQRMPNSIEITEQILEWLENPIEQRFTPEELKRIAEWDLDKLRKRFEELLREQTERHDGGNRWIGTGGTSPFGHGGSNPSGVRLGGTGGGRTAVQVASSRRFQNLRSDRVLDTRQIGVALRKLRRLERSDGPEELDIEKSIDASAKNAGEIALVFSPTKRNRIKLLMLMDVGGSMDAYSQLCERLFSAANAANYFKDFKYRFFHNCVYGQLYTDISRWKGDATSEYLKKLDATWCVIFVGDAWMAPYELTQTGGALHYFEQNGRTGFDWLREIRRRIPNSVWLNPVTQRYWNDESIRLICSVFPMFSLTLDGLSDAIDVLRGVKENRPNANRAPY